MSGDRQLRRTRRFDSSRLAALTRRPDAGERPEPSTEPAESEPPPALVARTTTLDDPLTTELLAEVARRSKTIEVSPEMVEDAAAEIDSEKTRRSR